jgi:HEAT repeat protein
MAFMVSQFVMAALVVTQGSASGQTYQSGSDEFEQGYVQAWEQSKADLNLRAIKSLVLDLSADEQPKRQGALAELTRQTGMRALGEAYVRFDEDGRPGEWAVLIQQWTTYAAELDTSVSRRVPVLLAKTTPMNQGAKFLAVCYLGTYAHPAFVPLLRAIAANRTEDKPVRIRAVGSIARTPHTGVIESLIELLGDDDASIGGAAWDQLRKLTRSGITMRDDERDFLGVKQRYEAWWAKNKGTFVYIRSRAMGEY